MPWGDEIVSLTWRDGIGFRWDADSFQRRASFPHAGEGWGLTQNGTSLIASDGSATIRFLDPGSMREISRVDVSARGKPLEHLNDLEWVNGEIWANVWLTDLIARIDPNTGFVRSWIDLRGLRGLMGSSAFDDVLNGLAFDAGGGRLFGTGKNWPLMFELRICT